MGWQSARYNFYLQKHLRLNCWGMSHQFLNGSEAEEWLIRGLASDDSTLPQDMVGLTLDMEEEGFCEKRVAKTSV